MRFLLLSKTLAIRSNHTQSSSKTMFPSWVHLDPFQPCHNVNEASVILVTLPAILAVRLGVLQSLPCFPVP